MYNKLETSIVISNSNDPWYNLALEEYLLDNIKDNQMVLYLWQNENTIVVGSNQNPWKECKCKAFEDDGGKIARRLSGGGTVFHDLGNLNFTFVTSRNVYDLKKQLSVILKAVNLEGLHAEFSGRNDITIDNKKFSGNAFYFKENKAYHHGTILINADMTKLSNYLVVSEEKIKSKGIQSVKSRVVNLKSLNTNITVNSMINNLKTTFNEVYGNISYIYTVNKDLLPLEDLYTKYSSWDFRYGNTPSFDISMENRFSWGNIDMNFSFKKGIIKNCKVYSDAMNNTFIESISNSLIDTKYSYEDIKNQLFTLINSEEEKNIIEDICSWLSIKNF